MRRSQHSILPHLHRELHSNPDPYPHRSSFSSNGGSFSPLPALRNNLAPNFHGGLQQKSPLILHISATLYRGHARGFNFQTAFHFSQLASHPPSSCAASGCDTRAHRLQKMRTKTQQLVPLKKSAGNHLLQRRAAIASSCRKSGGGEQRRNELTRRLFARPTTQPRAATG